MILVETKFKASIWQEDSLQTKRDIDKKAYDIETKR